MVHLKYVDNLFTEKNMLNISKFCDEKSFYDCINRRFLDDETFKDLDSTFHMYFLTGDSCENIGYVQFYNSDLVNNYFYVAYLEAINLLERFKADFSDICSQEKFNNLERVIAQNKKDGNYRVIVDDVTLFLKKISILSLLDYVECGLNDQTNYNKLDKFKQIIEESYNSYDYNMALDKLFALLNNSNNSIFQDIYDMFLDYLKQIEEYLNKLPFYYYLNVVIALPREEEIFFQNESNSSKIDINKLVELKYYGFIYEALVRVENEINQKFSDVPIFLENGSGYAINNDISLDKLKEKVKIIKNQ